MTTYCSSRDQVMSWGSQEKGGGLGAVGPGCPPTRRRHGHDSIRLSRLRRAVPKKHKRQVLTSLSLASAGFTSAVVLPATHGADVGADDGFARDWCLCTGTGITACLRVLLKSMLTEHVTHEGRADRGWRLFRTGADVTSCVWVLLEAMLTVHGTHDWRTDRGRWHCTCADVTQGIGVLGPAVLTVHPAPDWFARDWRSGARAHVTSGRLVLGPTVLTAHSAQHWWACGGILLTSEKHIPCLS